MASNSLRYYIKKCLVVRVENYNAHRWIKYNATQAA